MQRTTPYGAFLDLQDGTTALLHVNNMANPDNLDNPQPRQLVNDGDKLTVTPRRCPLLPKCPSAQVRVQQVWLPRSCISAHRGRATLTCRR